MGDVDSGNTVTDYLEEERERGITIVAAAITCRWKDVTINIIDTPGHVDFTAEVERSLRVLDGAIVIFSAVEGVEVQSETVWRQATKYKIPRICYINKMDRVGAEFERVFDEITERLEGMPIPVQIPIGSGPEGTMGEFKGLIDLINMHALYYKPEDLGSTETETEIPEDLRAEAELWRERMLNALSNHDEALAEAYMAHLEGAELVRGDRLGPPQGDAFRRRSARLVRVELQVRRRPAAVGRRRGVSAQSARSPACRGPSPQEGNRDRPRARPRPTVLRARVQDPERRARRPFVRARLLGLAQGGHARL